MRLLARLSLKRKLIAIIMATSTVALLLACSAFLIYELSVFRSNMEREAHTIAQILADSSTAALTFDDPQAAQEVLLVLANEPRMVAATIFDAAGNPFALYSGSGPAENLPPRPAEDGASFTDNHLELYKAIVFDGRRIGTVYLKSDLTEMYARLKQYASIATWVLLASLLAAFAVSSILQKVISGPVLDLAETAGRVSREKNYSIRAVRTSTDELGVLVERFNGMMEQIHSQDAALRKAQDELEERVQERTRELRGEIAIREQTERNLIAAKEAAEEANRTKSTFLANMSHELRTPLNAVIGYSELLEETIDEADTEESIQDLQKIHQAGRHLLALINDVLDLSKIEAGRMELRYQTVLAQDLVDYVVATVQPMARRNGNKLVVNCQPDTTFETDVTRFRQSLLNLLSNACKFTENGTISLDVELARKDGCAWICWRVGDTGIGIAPSDMNKLFQAFSQVDSSETRIHGGTGLGLAISLRLCKLMGGSINVESEPGEGSTFSMVLPCAQELSPDATPGLTESGTELRNLNASLQEAGVLEDARTASDTG